VHPPSLIAAHEAALAHVRAGARRLEHESLARIAAAGADPREVADMIAAIRDHGRITLNFHPDRLLADGRSVAEGLAGDGVYRAQWETGISNGGLTAFAGGDRDGWERELFGKAYHAEGVEAFDRPKYGGLNLAGHADGASPRFGSCHVRLRPEVNLRATFTVGDTAFAPTDLGTIDAFECVLAGLLEYAAQTGATLGLHGADPIAFLRSFGATPVRVTPDSPVGRALDDYIEAQVHGPIRLAVDAEAIVVDPSFVGSRTVELLRLAADRFEIALEWHGGFRVAPDEIPIDFRGSAIPPLALAIRDTFGEANGLLDAAMLGRAAVAVIADSEAWDRWGSRAEILQGIKYVWHALVRFGETG
jgi:hypothetical protein